MGKGAAKHGRNGRYGPLRKGTKSTRCAFSEDNVSGHYQDRTEVARVCLVSAISLSGKALKHLLLTTSDHH
jgi:hypothetical protein